MIAFVRMCALCVVSVLVAPICEHGALAADSEVDPGALQAADERQLSERAAALHDGATRQLQAAEQKLSQQNAACQRKFLVSSCLEDARRDYVKSKQEARLLEHQAKDIERELTRRQRERDAAERARRTAKKEQDAQRFRAESEGRAQESAARDADRARRQEEGRTRAAQEAQERQQQDAERAKRRAEKVEQARRRAEAAQRERAELDRRIAEKAQKKAEKEAKKGSGTTPAMPAIPPAN